MRGLASARIEAWRSSADMDLSWGAGEQNALVGVAGDSADADTGRLGGGRYYLIM